MASLALLMLMIMVAGASAATDRLPHGLNPQPTIDADLTVSARHERWMAKHGRVYKDAAEKERRLKIFRQNAEHIEAANRDERRTYKLGLNKFSDLTAEEFRASYTGNRFTASDWHANHTTTTKYQSMSDADTPSAVNWVEKGAVTGVKDQNPCGCCWAFAAVAAMEGAVQISTGNLLSLSEQEVLDCDVNGNDMGCDGGLAMNAYKFIVEHGGLASEDSYPYRKAQGTCDDSASPVATISSYETIHGEQSLMQAVANQPVAVSIYASADFQNYQSGVFNGPCDVNGASDLNHAVTVVGYGTDSVTGMSYWLAKNQWGSSWGEGGYIRMQKDADDTNGLCGIGIRPVYPVT